jgi:hypothetical protein
MRAVNIKLLLPDKSIRKARIQADTGVTSKLLVCTFQESLFRGPSARMSGRAMKSATLLEQTHQRFDRLPSTIASISHQHLQYP